MTTLEEYKKKLPKQQGYIIYFEAERPGSPLKDHQNNPYLEMTKEHADWEMGQFLAMLDAQDSE